MVNIVNFKILILLICLFLVSCKEQISDREYQVNKLIQQLDTPSKQLTALHRLARYNADANRAVDKIAIILKEAAWREKVVAMNTLSTLNTSEAKKVLDDYLPELVANISADDFETRLFAIQSIGFYKEKAVKALPALTELVLTGEKRVKEYIEAKRFDLAKNEEVLNSAARLAIKQIYLKDGANGFKSK